MMKLKTAKIVLAVGCGLMALFVLLCSALNDRRLGYIAVGFAVVTVIFWLIFGRCPTCGGYLGSGGGKYCPHCGEKLKE